MEFQTHHLFLKHLIVTQSTRNWRVLFPKLLFMLKANMSRQMGNNQTQILSSLDQIYCRNTLSFVVQTCWYKSSGNRASEKVVFQMQTNMFVFSQPYRKICKHIGLWTVNVRIQTMVLSRMLCCVTTRPYGRRRKGKLITTETYVTWTPIRKQTVAKWIPVFW